MDEFVGSVSKMAVAAVTVLVYLIPVSVFRLPLQVKTNVFLAKRTSRIFNSSHS